MKKFFVLMSFLFAVVCYAAPPPDVGLIADNEPEIEMLQVVASDVSVFADITIEAREVAYVDIGNKEVLTGTEVNALNDYATRTEHLMPAIYSNKNSLALNKSSGNGDILLFADAYNNNIEYFYLPNKQNTNFGYPKTAN